MKEMIQAALQSAQRGSLQKKVEKLGKRDSEKRAQGAELRSARRVRHCLAVSAAAAIHSHRRASLHSACLHRFDLRVFTSECVSVYARKFNLVDFRAAEK